MVDLSLNLALTDALPPGRALEVDLPVLEVPVVDLEDVILGTLWPADVPGRGDTDWDGLPLRWAATWLRWALVRAIVI